MMQPGDDKVVAERLFAVLSAKRSPRSTAMPAPSANVSGRWDVDIEFFSSRSRHTLFIEQDGNWIQGSHQGDFTARDVFGMIEGDQMQAAAASNGDPEAPSRSCSPAAVSGDTMSGPIHMGEYLNAKFTAKRHTYPERRGTILIPGGPPLAN